MKSEKVKKIFDCLKSIIQFLKSAFDFIWKIIKSLKLTTIVVSAGLGFGCGAYAYHSIQSGNPLVTTGYQIKRTIEYREKIIKQPVNCNQYIQAFRSPLNINGEFIKSGFFKQDVFRVKAFDEYREKQKDFYISSSGNWKFYIGASLLGAGLGGVVIYKIIKN